MAHPHKLPKPGKMLGVFALYAIGYTTFFWFGRSGFPELSAEVRLRLAQLGILTVYSAALLGGLSFFWSAKAKENSSIAVHRIANIDFQIGLLTQLQSEASHNFHEQIESLLEERSAENAILAEANHFPATLDRLGFASIFVLAIGTILQIFSLA
ncbi:hypothetical protein HKT17_10095 [Limnobacter sp. SAORIC-580]|uniref:DUF4199 domain-containing protein n=1 Tax=Limnobacter profundi TaxID=2732163 RepID=A0ABX6N8X0_9BURK|nr:hypothetical protein HKT17_10095 [Limnobacter sp. SAORIC-580]